MLAVAEPVVDPHTPRLWIERWPDEVSASVGQPATGDYAERFYLGILGPSAMWLLRTLAHGLEAAPSGFDLAVVDTARVLGLGERTGRTSPFVRAIGRLCQFELAHTRADTLVVRCELPWLDRRQVQRLPGILQHEHAQWEAAEEAADPVAAMRRRAATLALTTVRAGGTVDDAERALVRWRAHPSLCRTLAEWAVHQHGLAVAHARRAAASGG